MSLPQPGELFYIVSANSSQVFLTAADQANGQIQTRTLDQINNADNIAHAIWELLPSSNGKFYLVDQRHKQALIQRQNNISHKELEIAIPEQEKDGANRSIDWALIEQANGSVRIAANNSSTAACIIVPSQGASNALVMRVPGSGDVAEWRLQVMRTDKNRPHFVLPTGDACWTLSAVASIFSKKTLYLSVKDGSFRDGSPLVFATDAASGAAHFRFMSNSKGSFRLVNRESGKIVKVSNAKNPKYARLVLAGNDRDDDSELFVIKSVANGARQLQLAKDPRYAVKCGDVNGLAQGDFADLIGPNAGGIQLEIQPAYEYTPIERPGLVVNFNDEPFDYARAALGGMLQLAGAAAPIPGAGAVMGVIFNALWPANKQMSYDVLSRFRDDILRDVEAYTANVEFTRTRNLLTAARREMMVDYTTAKRTGIDDGRGSSDAVLSQIQRLASNLQTAPSMFIPGSPWTNPLPPPTATLLAAGMPVYLSSQVEYLAALAESMMLQAFDTRRASRSYLRQGTALLTVAEEHALLDAGTLDATTALELVPLGGGAVSSGDSISVRCSNDHYYFSVWQDAPAQLTAIATEMGRDEKLCMERIDAAGVVLTGDIRHNDRVTLTAANGLRLRADNGGGESIYANTLNRAAWETFTVIRTAGEGILRDGDSFALGVGSHFVSAGDGGGCGVNAIPTHASDWEKFTVVLNDAPATLTHGTRLGLRQFGSGKWLSALDGGGVQMSDTLSALTTFTIEAAERSRAFHSDDMVSLRTSNGKYLCVGTDGKLRADSATAVSFTLDVLAGTGAEPITEETISGFVTTVSSHTSDIRTTVTSMVESLVVVRQEAVVISKRTWEKRVTVIGQTTYETMYESKLVDNIRKRTLLENGSSDAYQNDNFGIAERTAYRTHLRWDYEKITYPANEAIARIDSLPAAVGAACRRLNSNALACTQFRYAALRGGMLAV
ncbi:MAG: hypothetical protein V4495_16120 [Pseudomonadota bacterium]